MSLVVVFGFAGRASATAACPIGNDLGTECQVNSLVTIAGGTYNFSEDLHVTSTGHIDVATGAGGATFNINGVAGLDLIVDGGGIIEAQDDQGGVAPCGTGGGNGPPAGNSACPLTFVTTGDVVLKAGSLISTNELNDGGSSADVNFTVGGNMTMCGPAGAHAGCGGPSGNVGAKILAEKLGDTGGGLRPAMSTSPSATSPTRPAISTWRVARPLRLGDRSDHRHARRRRRAISRSRPATATSPSRALSSRQAATTRRPPVRAARSTSRPAACHVFEGRVTSKGPQTSARFRASGGLRRDRARPGRVDRAGPRRRRQEQL